MSETDIHMHTHKKKQITREEGYLSKFREKLPSVDTGLGGVQRIKKDTCRGAGHGCMGSYNHSML